MPTRLRVDLAGYHHIINRGVNRCDVFNCNDDKETFLQIINKSATLHKIVLHDYCLSVEPINYPANKYSLSSLHLSFAIIND